MPDPGFVESGEDRLPVDVQKHIFPDEAPLRKTIEIRQHPLAFKDREDIKLWLKELGPVVQAYADVLEHELPDV